MTHPSLISNRRLSNLAPRLYTEDRETFLHSALDSEKELIPVPFPLPMVCTFVPCIWMIQILVLLVNMTGYLFLVMIAFQQNFDLRDERDDWDSDEIVHP